MIDMMASLHFLCLPIFLASVRAVFQQLLMSSLNYILLAQLSPEKKDDMVSVHQDRYRHKFRNAHLEKFEIGERISAFDPKSKNFSREGRLVAFDQPPSDNLGSRSYEIEFEEGERRKINNQWLVKFLNQNQSQDKN